MTYRLRKDNVNFFLYIIIIAYYQGPNRKEEEIQTIKAATAARKIWETRDGKYLPCVA